MGNRGILHDGEREIIRTHGEKSLTQTAPSPKSRTCFADTLVIQVDRGIVGPVPHTTKVGCPE